LTLDAYLLCLIVTRLARFALMARKKRQFLEDSDSDSASSEGGDGGFDETNDPDARAERELFADPYNHKRRQRDGKKDALYGVFASDDEDEGFGRKQRGGKEKRSDWTKAPAFVPGDTEKPSEEINKAMEEDEEDESEESEGDGEVEAQLEQKDDSDAMDTSDSEPSRPASPRMLVEGDHEEAKGLAPQIGGLGFGKSGGGLGFGRNTGGGLGFGKSTGGLGFSKATSSGLGFTSPKTTTTETMKFTSTPEPPTQSSSPPPSTSSANFPSSFGGDGRSTSAHNKPRPQRAFMREETPSSKAKVALSREEASHFTKLSGSFGARMLSKMGWEAGTGLGSSGEGIVTPIESKLRPQRAGIAHGGFREKTKQSVAEARRKGEIISDDEDDTGARKKASKGKAAPQKKREEAWKRPKKVKTRVEHKTYEQIIAEAGEEQASYSGIGQIIDATGATVSACHMLMVN
jgi:tuftelin-interacting protein 11